MVADMAGVKGVKKLERSVVNCQAQNAHVVGVHHTVAKACRLPGCHQMGGAFTHCFEQRRIRLRGVTARRVEVIYDIVGQRLEFGVLVGVAEVFKVPKSNKTGCRAGHDCGGFNFFTAHFGIRACHAQRARGRYAQPVHGFRAQIFTNRAAQHCAAIAHAGIGRATCTLELQLRPTVAGFKLTEQDGPAIAKLAGPLAKLVAAVNTGQWFCILWCLISGKNLQRRLRFKPAWLKVQLARDGHIAANPVRRWQRLRLHACVKVFAQLRKAVAPWQAGLGFQLIFSSHG